MSSPRIPILALTGFLGSGKTTLLNHILEQASDAKIGVVVNDYGDINIDAQFIEAETDATLELTNGCICCSLDSMDLDEAIAQFAYPGSPIDCIIIEASGLAEPADLAAMLRRALPDHARLDAIVAVLDAANLDPSIPLPAIVQQQIDHSDIIIINKLDLVGAQAVEQLRTVIAKRNPRARVLTSSHAAVEISLLLDPDITPEPKPAPDSHDHTGHSHLHHRYQSLSFTNTSPLDPLAFQELVNRHLPASIYRAKGIVNFGSKGHNRKYHFQLVGKRAELTWDEWGDQAPRTELVMIGQDFDQDALWRQLQECVGSKPHAGVTDRPISLPRHH